MSSADRSPHVRDEARVRGVQVRSKPLKPVVLMAQWRRPRVVAAELPE